MFGCCSKSIFTNYHMVLKRVVLRNLKLSSFLVFEDTCMTDNDGSNNLLFEKSPLCDLYNKRLVQEQAKNVQDLKRLLYKITRKCGKRDSTKFSILDRSTLDNKGEWQQLLCFCGDLTCLMSLWSRFTLNYFYIYCIYLQFDSFPDSSPIVWERRNFFSESG